MENHPAALWAAQTQLEPIHIDCTTAVMLKILDGKCKMNPLEKEVMAIVYDVVKDRPMQLLDSGIHELIAVARADPAETILHDVYEQRMYAEQRISRPVMKAYKAMLRQAGIIGIRQPVADEAEEE